MKIRRWLFAVAIFSLPLQGYLLWAGYIRFFGPSVENSELVGLDEAQILSDYGSPETDVQGYEMLGPEGPPSRPAGAIRTLTYRPRGLKHPGGGTLYVWLVERGGVWLCFESCWFRDGVQF
jgi:hypothetical protein